MNFAKWNGIESVISLKLSMLVQALLVALAFLAVPSPATAQSGQVWLVAGKTILEPAYNDLDGSTMYLLTPYGTPIVDPTNVRAQAPLYIIVYPRTVGPSIGVMDCQHYPYDNCPDHGPAVSGAAEFLDPAVYGAWSDGSTGVWGHDHVAGKPPATPRGGTDYNVAWEPVLVLFTSQQAAENHITTLAQLQAAEKAGQAVEFPNPADVFQCSSVSATVYANGTPVSTAPPTP